MQKMASYAGLFGHSKVIKTVQLVAGKLTKEIIVAGSGTEVR